MCVSPPKNGGATIRWMEIAANSGSLIFSLARQIVLAVPFGNYSDFVAFRGEAISGSHEEATD